jgi:hypothetical protein
MSQVTDWDSWLARPFEDRVCPLSFQHYKATHVTKVTINCIFSKCQWYVVTRPVIIVSTVQLYAEENSLHKLAQLVKVTSSGVFYAPSCVLRPLVLSTPQPSMTLNAVQFCIFFAVGSSDRILSALYIRISVPSWQAWAADYRRLHCGTTPDGRYTEVLIQRSRRIVLLFYVSNWRNHGNIWAVCICRVIDVSRHADPCIDDCRLRTARIPPNPNTNNSLRRPLPPPADGSHAMTSLDAAVGPSVHGWLHPARRPHQKSTRQTESRDE